MIEQMFFELYSHEVLKGFEHLDIYIKDKVYELKRQSLNQTKSHWNCPTFNTLDMYNLFEDESLSPLFDTIKQKVEVFSKEFGTVNPVVETEHAWINLALPGEFQEYHIHPMNHFSIVYYVSVPENSGSIRWKNHRSFFDMYPLHTSKNTLSNANNYYYVPSNHELIIFRSYLPHMVDYNTSQFDRVSISANFKVLDRSFS